MSNSDDALVQRVGERLALELGHTLASINPIVLGPNTERLARAVLDVLSDELAAARNWQTLSNRSAELIEAVAMAMGRYDGVDQPNAEGLEWSNPEVWKDRYRQLARVAVDALTVTGEEE